MSVALDFASGVLLATICFEMLPEALEMSSLPIAVGGFAVGFAAVYGFDLFIHRGKLVGEAAEQRPQVERFYQQRRPRGSEVTVLAGGTSAPRIGTGRVVFSARAIPIGARVSPRQRRWGNVLPDGYRPDTGSRRASLSTVGGSGDCRWIHAHLHSLGVLMRCCNNIVVAH
jgi:hypothetical protein